MAANPSEFSANGYLAAALEHQSSLDLLYQRRQYVLAMYVAGLAVECVFRAYIQRRTNEFDSRHNLYELARTSSFVDRVPLSHVAEYTRAVSEVAGRWANSHRYRSSAAMQAYLKRMKLDRGIRGDALKENARRIINAANALVELGATLWTH